MEIKDLIFMMNFKNKKGFTLVEIIITIALLGITLIVILGLFSNNIQHIFSSGKKDEAIAEASNVMDKIYSIDPGSESEIADALDITKVNCNQLYNNTNANISRYCLDKLSDGFKVTVVVYYLNGKRNVSLTSFVRKE